MLVADPNPTQSIDEQAAYLLGRLERVFADHPAVGKPPKEAGGCADPERAVRPFGQRSHLPEREWTGRGIRLDPAKARLVERSLENETGRLPCRSTSGRRDPFSA